MASETIDRYVTFKNIDCAGNSKRLMQMLLRHIDDPSRSNPFWEKFKEKLSQAGQVDPSGRRHHDELFLIHTYVNNLYELFEERDDSEALELLEWIERECC